MSSQIIKEKIEQASQILNEKNIDMWITFVRESSVSKDPAMEMISEFNCTWQSAFIINKDGSSHVIVGSLELDKFQNSGLYQKVTGYLKSIKEPFVEYISEKDPKSIAVNFSADSNLADGLTHGMYLILLEHLKETPYGERLVSSEEIISALKGRKSAAEIAIMKEAIVETLKIFDKTGKFIKPGRTEIEIAEYMKKLTAKRGFGLAWEEDHCPAVFTGPETGGAHSGPTDTKVEPGHLVNIDFGILYKGYCSDLQRTWYVLRDGETIAPPEVIKGFEVIKESIQKTAKALKPGVQGCEMDDIARNYIVEQGYEEYPHGLGHQVGRQVHDGGAGLFPRWERYGNNPFKPVEESQVFTIEPRLTVKGHGTSTLEEEVVVTKTGCEFLSKPQRKLMLIK